MKDINQFITEKFKVTSKNAKYNSYNEELIDSIDEHFGFKKHNKEIIEAIEKWVIDNNVKNIYYYCDYEILEELKNIGVSDEIINDFNTNHNKLMDCIDAFEDYDELYNDDVNNFSICANKTILAFLGDNGNGYASIKKF